MAEIYRAVTVGDGGFRKEVVLKLMRPELASDPRFVEMFLEEARLAAALSHANIVQVLDFGRVDGEYYLALESVHGLDLRQLLDQLRREKDLMPLELAALVGIEIARALDYAHRRQGPDGSPLGLVHRDVSPQNVLLSLEGEVKLADFGVAKAAGQGNETEPGTLKGKIAYMSPEQARGEPLDQRSDLYSLGRVLEEAFTGEQLTQGENSLALLRLVQEGHHKEPRRAGEPLPAPLATVLERALAPRREERFQSAAELLLALESAAEQLPHRARPTDLARYLRSKSGGHAAGPLVPLDELVEQQLGRAGDLASSATSPAPSPVPRAGGPVGARPSTGTSTRTGAAVLVLVVAALALLALTLTTMFRHRTAERRPLAAGAVQPSPALASGPRPGSQPSATEASSRAADARVTARAREGDAPAARRGLSRKAVVKGVVRFSTDPAYAEVWVDGIHRCNTPCAVELPVGAHRARLVNPTLRRELARAFKVSAQHSRERPLEVTVTGFR